MGGGVSSSANRVLRLRKSIVIRAYNVRPSLETTLDEQFKREVTRIANGDQIISLDSIRVTLKLGVAESLWLSIRNNIIFCLGDAVRKIHNWRYMNRHLSLDFNLFLLLIFPKGC
jgi:hypothetical protein